jgi:hypothetical protein
MNDSQMRAAEREQVEKDFNYHQPTGDQPERYTKLRNKAKELAYLIYELCPPCRERSLALTNLEQSGMWANASIARSKQS